MDMVWSLLTRNDLPKSYWLEVVNWSIILNRIPTLIVKDKIQEKAWSGRLMISHLRIFGCIVYAYIPIERGKNLMINEKNMFFLVFVIIQKLIKYIILTPLNLLLVKILFFIKFNFGHKTMVVNQNIIVYLDSDNNEIKEV